MEENSINDYVERQTIMQAACTVLSRSDVQITRRELARRAGVTPATLQKHFRSLADLQAEMTKAKASGETAETDTAGHRVDA